MKCIECNGSGGHYKEFTHEGKRYKRRKPCNPCNGTGEVSANIHKQQLAELSADDKNDQIKLRQYEKAGN